MSRKVDLSAARKFLSTLAPNEVAFTYQLFSDSVEMKQRNPETRKLDDPNAQIIVKPFAEAVQLLVKANARGVGVFVTINATKGNGRKLANFAIARALFADLDGAPMPKWPVAPTMIVESSPGKFHCYWCLADDMPLETWRGCMRRMVETYGADKAASDPVRVLRLPGFYHCKHEPVMVKLAKCSGRPYTAARLVKVFPPIKRKMKKLVKASSANDTVDADVLRSALSHLATVPHPRAKHSETYADDYDTWIRFGLAIKRGLGDDGFEVWDEWARTSGRHSGDAASRAKWDSFDIEGRYGSDAITVGTIFDCAKRNGWSFGRFQTANLFQKGLAALRAERRAA